MRGRIRLPFRRHRSQETSDPLAGIRFPSPFDMQQFCDAVAEHRGRPLLVEAVEGVNGSDGGLCGLWVELDHADCIFYEASTSPLHRNHIVLHEISHILLGHTTVSGTDPGADIGGLFTGVDPHTVRNVLGRANFSSPQEREAEQLATRIAGLAKLQPMARKRAPELDRIDAALRYE